MVSISSLFTLTLAIVAVASPITMNKRADHVVVGYRTVSLVCTYFHTRTEVPPSLPFPLSQVVKENPGLS